jgi:hypothetical protein
MLAALRPELFGPIIIAGSPLSYWGGVHGRNPMRYSGGLLGGTWLTALTSDLGGGKFDGAWLVKNFENQNPANTLWTKQYNVYSNIDTEAPRYLGFERYWGGYVNLNAEEIQFIVDELFVGNKLAAGMIKTSDGAGVDLRNIQSPIVVFCSKGDNITPPQQALDWILDLYDDVDEIRSYGQTIVYTIHDKIGHLGIFVSGPVAKKEHNEFANNIDLIDTLPPGLYEAVFEPKTGTTAGADLVTGDWVMRCEMRTLDDIRALGCNDAADERRFATAARVSEVNLALYRTFAQPIVRAMVSGPVAETLHQLHPLRIQYEMFSNANPFVAPIEGIAEEVRKNRRPVADGNPLLAMQENMSKQIVAALDGWRDFIEAASERTFLMMYGSPALQAAVGIDPSDTRPIRKAPKNRLYHELVQKRIAELKSRIPLGGVREAVARALIYVGMGRRAVDERGFETLRRLRQRYDDVPLSEFKALVREQYFMLLIDETACLTAIPSMLPSELDPRSKGFDLIKEVMAAMGKLSAEDERRLREIGGLFGLEQGQATTIRFPRREVQAKAS